MERLHCKGYHHSRGNLDAVRDDYRMNASKDDSCVLIIFCFIAMKSPDLCVLTSCVTRHVRTHTEPSRGLKSCFCVLHYVYNLSSRDSVNIISSALLPNTFSQSTRLHVNKDILAGLNGANKNREEKKKKGPVTDHQ